MSVKGFFDDYRYLSNFHHSTMTINRITWPTVEHYYQAMKTADTTMWERMARLTRPGDARVFGQLLSMRSDWDQIKLAAMYKGLVNKFSDPLLRTCLLTTPGYLEETNGWGDKFWGKVNNEGENWLGYSLMYIRDRIIPNLSKVDLVRLNTTSLEILAEDIPLKLAEYRAEAVHE